MKRLSQSGSSNFCPELRKNALLISQSYFSNFALHMIMLERELIWTTSLLALIKVRSLMMINIKVYELYQDIGIAAQIPYYILRDHLH